jgi:hypothetical protein
VPEYTKTIRELRTQRGATQTEQRGPTSRKRLKKTLEKESLRKWTARWTTSKKGRDIYTLNPIPDQKTPKLYMDRARPISSITIQLRSQKIGLQGFLHRQRVPGIDSPICPYCREKEETTEHFLLECGEWERERGLFLASYRERSLNSTLKTREGCLAAARFVIATKRLEQYRAIALEQLI